MKFIPMAVDGAWIIEPQFKSDDRGMFGRVWDSEEFSAHGLTMAFVQCNNSVSRQKGILRGLHWQKEPFGETKLIRCIKGSIYDVAADVRPYSPTFGKYAGVELTSNNRHWFYVPSGCAHGFLALEDDSEVLYAVTVPYAGHAEDGIRWNDPQFNIQWPAMDNIILSQKDQSWPDFKIQ